MSSEGKLNFKKIIAIIIAIIVITMIVIMIKNIFFKKEQKVERQINYYASFKDNKWGVINSNGTSVIDPSYQELIIIPNSKKDVFLCTYNVNYETGEFQTKALNSQNQEILQGYDKVEPMTNSDENQNIWYEKDIIKVTKDGKYGIIDLDGNEIIPAQYAEITVLGNDSSNGYRVKNDEGKYGALSSTNEQILETKYDVIEKAHNDNLYVVKEGENKKIINKDGQEIVTEGFDSVSAISQNYIIFIKDKKYGIMDLEGNIKVNPTYDRITQAKEDTFIARKGDGYGVIDSSENEKIPFNYNNISYNKEADAYIIEDNDYNAKILNGNFEEKISSGMFLDINTELKYIKMRDGDDYKYYNFNFEEKPSTEILTNNTLFLSKKDGKYGFINKKGDVVIDYQYDDATEQNEDGYAGIKKDGKWGSVDSEGAVIVEPCYNLEEYLHIDFVGRWHKGLHLDMHYYSQE